MGWLSNAYGALDASAGGWLPGGVTRSQAVQFQEFVTRDLADRLGLDPQGRLPDFAVGAQRILGAQVGRPNPLHPSGTNPTLAESWRSADSTFSGWLPGGTRPEVPGLPGPAAPWLIGAAALIAVAVLR